MIASICETLCMNLKGRAVDVGGVLSESFFCDQVFADINRAQERGARPEKHKDDKQPYTPSFLKL